MEAKSNDITKEEKEKTDSEDDEFILKERERLIKLLSEHKGKVLKILSICMCIEVVLVSIYINISSGTSLANLFDIYHDTLDCALSIPLRLISLYILTMIANKYGSEIL